MAYGFVPIVHIVAMGFSLVELGLTGYLVSAYDHPWAQTPSQEGFMLFNAIWSLLVLAYVGLAPLYYTRIFHRLFSLVLEGITMIFWFAGSIALAVMFGGPYHCGANTYCGSVEAAIAFGFFLWAIFAFLVVLDAMESMRSRDHTATHPRTKPYVGA
ncbi:hypothetical protein GQ53DRAFT_659009 [Thozetella sp. PMI_491]|nr:hypothetical protein GQ53DRAFT_659009 [Thozetella sp. PMI_491]